MILAIDTSTEWIGLALFDGTQILAENVWRSKNYHTVELVPAIDQMMGRAGVKPRQLSGVGVALGPGSFTGLRIGMSAAKGVALALNLKIVGIPSLEILVHGQPGLRRPMIAILEVGRGRFAHQRYHYQKSSWEAEGDMRVDDIKTIAATIHSPVYVVGEMKAGERQIMARKWKTTRLASPSHCLRRPSVLAELAWKRLQDDQTLESAVLAPIYVHTLSNVPQV